jgi:hypothetical protein
MLKMKNKSKKRRMFRGRTIMGNTLQHQSTIHKNSKNPIFFSIPGIKDIDQQMEHSRSQMIEYGYPGYAVAGIGQSLLKQMETSKIKYSKNGHSTSSLSRTKSNSMSNS